MSEPKPEGIRLPSAMSAFNVFLAGGSLVIAGNLMGQTSLSAFGLIVGLPALAYAAGKVIAERVARARAKS